MKSALESAGWKKDISTSLSFSFGKAPMCLDENEEQELTAFHTTMFGSVYAITMLYYEDEFSLEWVRNFFEELLSRKYATCAIDELPNAAAILIPQEAKDSVVIYQDNLGYILSMITDEDYVLTYIDKSGIEENKKEKTEILELL